MRQPAFCLPFLLLTAACGAVPGTSTYGCGGLPEGVSCISARDVYKLTDSGKPVVSVEGKATALDTAPANDAGPGGAPAAADSAQPAVATPASPAPGVSRGGPDQPGLQNIALRPEDAGAMAVVPLRTPSRVLRVWIAPWEDDAGRLHVPGFTYAEIEPRRWSIGEDQPGRGMTLRPLPAPPGPRLPTPPQPPEQANEPEIQDTAVGDPPPRRQGRPRPPPRRQPDVEPAEIRFNSVRQDVPTS